MTHTPRKALRVLVLVLAVVSAGTVFAQSQATTGVIEGIVSDSGRRAPPGGDGRDPEHGHELREDRPSRAPTAASGASRSRSAPTASPRRSRASRRSSARASTSRSARRSTSRLAALDLAEGRGDHGDRRRARRRDDADGGRRPARHGVDPGPPEQRPQLHRVHEAHPRRLGRPGARRRRADRERPEGHQQQRLRGRRRLQQPVLRRAARRPAPRVHVQPRRGQGDRRRRRRGARRVRARERRVRERRDEVRHERLPRERGRLLQERRPRVRAR